MCLVLSSIDEGAGLDRSPAEEDIRTVEEEPGRIVLLEVLVNHILHIAEVVVGRNLVVVVRTPAVVAVVAGRSLVVHHKHLDIRPEADRRRELGHNHRHRIGLLEVVEELGRRRYSSRPWYHMMRR